MASGNLPKHTLYGFEPASDRRGLIASLAQNAEAMVPGKVRQLRRALFEDEVLARPEAEALFALERAQKGRAGRDWTKFFVETLTDHLVWRGQPGKILDHETARWLIVEADRNLTPAVYALLAHVLAEAESAPAWFVEAVRARGEADPVRAALACA
ncbi:hypothetical protein CCR94_20600 [Rhodoblastus sphagnicola]|uniref:Uncharacterized protein n=1 Tax=Rhodoblastus sphagnicola TaxID=333368 RepID=A0A2S6MXZ1_9HYPH|nr:hypothetical protein [Rhodoblastus sphagnicola]MBB4198092.1 hypothetical protein [Rhodoblastus sphagnicola]PPQ27233.1 hypothetical protein CCR94_20600 [Rhodoblastus sphagnicola]